MDILNLFSLDLLNYPDDNFTLVGQTDRPNGAGFKEYAAGLTIKEKGLFDIIDIVLFETGTKNVTLKTYDIDLIDLTALDKLIKEICSIYGADSKNKSELTLQEIEYLEHPILYSQFSRQWDTPQKYKYPMAINRTSEDLSLTVWSIGK